MCVCVCVCVCVWYAGINLYYKSFQDYPCKFKQTNKQQQQQQQQQQQKERKNTDDVYHEANLLLTINIIDIWGLPQDHVFSLHPDEPAHPRNPIRTLHCSLVLSYD